MRGKATYVVRAGLCVALLVAGAQVGKAQGADLPPVPDALATNEKSTLAARRERLINAETRLRSRAADHDGQCRQISAQSASAAACVARRDSLRTAAGELQREKEQFTNDVAELNRLLPEESALSQAIRAGVERIRSMVDEATEASQEQVNLLSEELKRQLEERRRFRVRRATAVLGVRG